MVSKEALNSNRDNPSGSHYYLKVKQKSSIRLRAGLHILLDLYFFIEPKYIRKSQRGFSRIFATISPRLYFITLGIIRRINPNHVFNSTEFSSLFPPGTLSHRFPTIKYLITSSGRTPQSQFDLSYISTYPDLREFRKSLLVHYFRYGISEERDLQVKKTPLYQYRNYLWSSPAVSGTPDVPIRLVINSCRTIDFFNLNNGEKITPNLDLELIELKHEHVEGFVPLSNEVKIEQSKEVRQISLTTHGNLFLDLEHLKYFLILVSTIPNNSESFLCDLIREYIEKSDYDPNVFFLAGANQTFSVGTFRLNKSKRTAIDVMHRKFETEKVSKILLVSHDDSLSGAPMFVLQLHRQLVARNFEVKILILKKLATASRNSAFINNEDDVFYLEDLWLRTNSLIAETQDTVDLEVALKYLFLIFRPDLVIANTVVSAETILSAESSGIPTILLVHEAWGFSRSESSNYTPQEVAISKAFEGANLVVFGSSSAQAKWKDPRLRLNSMVLPSLRSMSAVSKVSESAKMNLRKQFNIPQDAFVYLAIGSFEERKRTLDAIHAFVNLEARIDFLILVGDWKMDDVYCTAVRDLASNYTNVKTFPTTGDLEPFYLLADCLIFMSAKEVYPLVLQEAAIYGLARITSRYPGYIENLKNHDSALSYEVGDVNALTSAMQIIRDNSEIRKEIVIRAEKVVSENRLQAELYFDRLLERLSYPHITKVRIPLND